MKQDNGALRHEAEAMFGAAVQRADPASAVRAELARAPLDAAPEGGRLIVIALGKAAVPMLEAALEGAPGPVTALAVTNPENMRALAGAEVICGAHPEPDDSSAAAGRAIVELLDGAGARDRVLALISGGGSALAVAPAPGLTLADKRAVNALLLASGLEINDMNLIRQQLSDLKGGGWLRHAAPAPVRALTLSDVIGDDLRAIASGPTVAPIGTRAAARTMMQASGIWDAAPEAVRARLSQAAPELTGAPQAQNRLIGSNRHSLEAMRAAALARGWAAEVVSDCLTGDVADAARQVLVAAADAPRDRDVALLWGGETTVRLRGDGLGGRNQELALRVALGAGAALGAGWVFLSGGTDGRDGPTDAAGGVVDGASAARIAAAGGDGAALLENNDSYKALALAGDLLMTGGTGTNVADMQVFLRRASG